MVRWNVKRMSKAEIREFLDKSHGRHMEPVLRDLFSYTFLVVVACKVGLIWVFLGWIVLFRVIDWWIKRLLVSKVFGDK